MQKVRIAGIEAFKQVQQILHRRRVFFETLSRTRIGHDLTGQKTVSDGVVWVVIGIDQKTNVAQTFGKVTPRQSITG
jgi:hypothetical protein